MSNQKHLTMTKTDPIWLGKHRHYQGHFLANRPWGVSVSTYSMKRHLNSRNPALNVPRRHEAVATDTVYSDTPAVDSGVKQAQPFVGKESLFADIYPMRSGK